MANDISHLSDKEIVEIFIKESLKQYKYNDEMETSKYNKVAKKLYNLTIELQSRQGDARHLLLRHISDENLQLKFNIAVYCFDLSPELAKSALESISATNLAPYAFDAKMTLFHIDKGWINKIE